MKGNNMEENKLTFAQSIARLEEIVSLMDRGDVSLEESLALFEEGTALIRSAGAMLDSAEQKVVKLMKGPDGTPVETDFEMESEDQ